MVRLTAALISAIHDGADIATISSLIVPGRDLDQLVGLEVCERLSRLDLSNNRLSSLEGITLCTSLTWLSVAGNQLTSLKGVENLTKLTVLNGSRNAITSMSQVALLTELRAVILNDNELTSVCRLDGLIHLTTIVLSRNPIRNLGNFASKLVSLKKLSASHCEVQVLGTALKRCVTIEELRLAHNQLSILPQELERNGRLTILDLGTNHFQNWSDLQVLGTLHNLVNLNLRGNPICLKDDYEAEVRKRLPHLQVLDGDSLHEGHKKKNVKKLQNDKEGSGGRKVATDSAHLRESSTGDTIKRKVKQDIAEAGSADSKSRPFLDMILPSSRLDDDVEGVVKLEESGKAKKRKNDSGVVSVVEVVKDRDLLGRRKRVGELISKVVPNKEIGEGGPSTWGDEPGPSTPEMQTSIATFPEQVTEEKEHKPYSRWQLKKSK